MVKQLINTGVEGNDATGDPIRDAFNKVNDNFNELYAFVGRGGGISFTKLEDVPEEFEAGKLLAVNPQGNALIYKEIVEGDGISIDNSSNANEIKISSTTTNLFSDPTPKLGNHLDANTFNIYRLADPDDAIANTNGWDPDSVAMNRGFSDNRFIRKSKTGGDTMTTPLNVPAGATGTQVPRANEVVRKVGGIDNQMQGDLILAGNPLPDSNPLTAATKNYVDTTSFASQVNLFVSTSGDDKLWQIENAKKGRALSYAFKTINRACREAERIAKSATIDLGPNQKLITYTVNNIVSNSIISAYTLIPSTPNYYLDITHGGSGTNPRLGSNYDIRVGHIIRGVNSKALVSIISVGIIGASTERYTVTPISGTLQVGEELEYGDKVGNKQITIIVEGGEYFENYPIRVPENTSIVGDDVRRTIIRPLPGVSGSIWSNIYFRRDTTIDELTTASQTFGYQYLSSASQSLYSNTITNPGSFIQAEKLIIANKGFIQAETIGYINQTFKTIVTTSTSGTNRFTGNNISNLNVNMSISFNGTLGGITAGTVYYIKEIFTGTNQFTISTTPGGSAFVLTTATGSMTGSFAYNQSLCNRDVGYIVEAIAADLNEGLYANALEAGVSYLRNASGEIAIGTTQLTQTLAAMQRVGSLIVSVLNKSLTYTSYQTGPSIIAPTYSTSYTAEGGSISASNGLITLINNIISSNVSFNTPKNNEDLDIFLLNNATSLRDFNCQGHGGFMCVFDPEGQVLTKSPYVLSCSSISGSINAHRFAGGIFADGFAGNLQALITTRVDSTTMNVSGTDLIIRLPRTPCSFYIKGVRFQVDYIDNINQQAGTATIHLNENTPDTLAYNKIGTLLPSSTTIEFITPGNKSMLCSHFTQINDMGYGILSHNNALIETVSVFVYYCYRGYYSLGGAQIRSVNGSCSFGQFGLCAEGADPTEEESVVTLVYPMTQIAKAYTTGTLASANAENDTSLYVYGLLYPPLNTSKVDVKHSTGIVTYDMNNALTTSVPDVYEIKLTTPGGLVETVANDADITIRTSRTTIVGNVLNVRPTRPSTALTYIGENDIYRVYSFTKDRIDPLEATLFSSIPYNYVLLYADATAGLTSGSGQVGDTQVRITPLNPADSARIVGKEFGWWGTVHTVTGYESTTVTGQTWARISIYPALTYTTALASFDGKTPIMYAGFNTTRNFPISSIARSSNVATIVTSTAHKLSPGASITIRGITTSGFNNVGITVLATPTTTSFTYSNTGSNVSTTSVISGVVYTSQAVTTNITVNISLTRVSSHDLLSIGTGSYADTNFPNNLYGPPVNTPSQTNEVVELGKGRVFYTTVDQDGIIRFGDYFSVDQGTGVITTQGTVSYSNVQGIGFARGVTVAEFSTDDSMFANATDIVPVQAAIVGYLDRRLGITITGNAPVKSQIGPGFLPVSGSYPMGGNFNINNYRIIGLPDPLTSTDATTKGYVDLNFLQRAGGTRTGITSFTMAASANGVIDMNNNRIINLAAPTVNGDATNKLYVDTLVSLRTNLSGLSDVGIVTVSDSHVLSVNFISTVITSGSVTSVTGTGPWTVTFTTTFSTSSLYVGAVISATPGSGSIGTGGVYVVSSITAGTPNTIVLTSTGGTTPSTGTITNVRVNRWTNSLLTNSNISSTAAIAQSKLSIANSTTGLPNSPPATNGLSSFDNNFFSSNSGFISLIDNGISLTKLSQLNARSVIGNNTLGSANATNVAFSDVVTGGGGLRRSDFTGDGVVYKATDTFAILGYNSSNVAGNLVLRDASGNFSAGTASLSQLTISLYKAIDSTSISSINYLNLYSPDSSSVAALSIRGNSTSIISTFTGTINADSIGVTAGNISTGTLIGASGTVGSITGTGPWTARITGLTTTASLTVGSYITFVEGTGSLGRGGLYTVANVISNTEISFTATGGTTPIAGSISLIRSGGVVAPIINASTQFNVGGSRAFTNSGTAPNQNLEMYTPQGGIFLSSRTVSNVATTTVSGNWILGTGATLEATYADLAEYYEADKDYDPGTVLMLGGDKEVTIASGQGTTKVVGVVSTNPAYTMNIECKGNKTAIALQGRVPCKVIGKIEKGDMLVVGLVSGVAMASNDPKPGSIIGKALENYNSDFIGIIEVIIGKH